MDDSIDSGPPPEFADLIEARQVFGSRAPTMGTVAKIRYSHTDMIDFIIANPAITLETQPTEYPYLAAMSFCVMPGLAIMKSIMSV